MNFWTALDVQKMLHLPLHLFNKELRFYQRLLNLYFNHLLKSELDNIFIKITSCSLLMVQICYAHQIRQIRIPIFQVRMASVLIIFYT